MNKGRQHSFFTLFQSVDAVEIPIVQRDYAQGRAQSAGVRLDFLTALHDALRSLDGSALDLDFVYGAFEKRSGKVLSLLDGQQRLTTLFLLHWYVALCEGRLDDFRGRWVRDGRSRFTYAIRPSSAAFFDALAMAVLPVSSAGTVALPKLSDRIVDSQWFFLSWQSDPTVKACLGTLDSIQSVFGVTDDLYPILVDEHRPRITFHFLDLEHFGLSDDLYIKMNARGKPLTPFENFKAWLVGRVSGEPWAARFDVDMDQRWMDLFWRLARKQRPAAVGELFDELFLRFMYVMAFFAACRRVDRVWATPRATLDWIGHLRLVRGHLPLRDLARHDAFRPDAVQVISVVLDYFCISATPEDLGVLELALGGEYQDLARLYALVAFIGSRSAQLPPAERVMGRTRWDRVTSNLVANTRIDELGLAIASIKALDALAAQAHRLYENLAENKDLPPGFGEQMVEESRKARLILEDPTREHLLVQAERHPYLQGRIGFLLDFSQHAEDAFDADVFEVYAARARSVLDDAILNSPEHLLERALLSIDDYLPERTSNRYYFCQPNAKSYRDRSENWLKVVARPGFRALLDRIDSDAKPSLRAVIAEAECTDWRRFVVAEPQIIDYCKERLIYRDEARIFLLSKKTTGGYYAELHTYALFLKLQQTSEDWSGGETHYFYAYAYDYDDPSVSVLFDGRVVSLRHKAGSWECTAPEGAVTIPEKLAEFMRANRFID